MRIRVFFIDYRRSVITVFSVSVSLGMVDEQQESEAHNPNPVFSMLPLLQTNLLHRTSVGGFKGIYKAGSIRANTGQFEFSTARSEGSYGQSNGYVCLFDFESAEEARYLKTHHIWAEFFYNLKPVTITLKLNREQLAERLIPNSDRPKPGKKDYRLSIPLVEVWYPDEIPVSAISSYIITHASGQGIIFCQFAENETSELDSILSLPDLEVISAIRERSEADTRILGKAQFQNCL